MGKGELYTLSGRQAKDELTAAELVLILPEAQSCFNAARAPWFQVRILQQQKELQ